MQLAVLVHQVVQETVGLVWGHVRVVVKVRVLIPAPEEEIIDFGFHQTYRSIK